MLFDLAKTIYYFLKNLVIGIFFINKKIQVHYTVKIKGSNFAGNNRLYRFVQLFNSALGRFTYIGESSIVNNASIGSFCSIGPNVKIGLGIHPTNLVSTSPVFYSPPRIFNISFTNQQLFQEYRQSIIGNDVWIGANAVILDGVEIGNGAVIAAGAVVVDDVPPYSIYGGVPAKQIRKRFDDATIDELENYEWWKLSISELKLLSPDFIDVVQFKERVAFLRK